MKKTLLSLVLVLALCASASAQTGWKVVPVDDQSQLDNVVFAGVGLSDKFEKPSWKIGLASRLGTKPAGKFDLSLWGIGHIQAYGDTLVDNYNIEGGTMAVLSYKNAYAGVFLQGGQNIDDLDLHSIMTGSVGCLGGFMAPIPELEIWIGLGGYVRRYAPINGNAGFTEAGTHITIGL